MTKDLVAVTIGVGPEHAALAEKAAARMRRFADMDVLVLGRAELERRGLSDPNHLKFHLFDLVDAEHLLYFDADAFCLRPWDPRTLLGGAEFTAVRGFWFDERMRRLGDAYGFGEDTHNGGFFLCNRARHAAVLRLAAAVQPRNNAFPGLVNPDEIAVDVALKALGEPIRFLDRRYNWLQYGRGGPEDWAGVVLAHACDPALRRLYLSPDFPDPGDRPVEWDAGDEFRGKTFLYERIGHDRRAIHFRDDGTIGAGGGDAERFYYSRRGPEGAALVLASAWEETCTLERAADGAWRGHWSRYEQMPVRLSRHPGQALIDLLRGRRAPGRALTAVMVGAGRGETAAVLLRGLPDLRLWMIDSWRSRDGGEARPLAYDEALFRAGEATAFAAGRRTLAPCDPARAALLLPDGLDLVFLDADYGYEATREALAAWRPKLAQGGLMAGRGYRDPAQPGVRPAVDELAAVEGPRVRADADGFWSYEVPS